MNGNEADCGKFDHFSFKGSHFTFLNSGKEVYNTRKFHSVKFVYAGKLTRVAAD